MTHTAPEGGLFVWAALPEGQSALSLFDRAVENNVAFVPGTHFYPEGGHENTFRLNFSNSPVDVIETGHETIGRTDINAIRTRYPARAWLYRANHL